ncbi:alpha/beta hydrolase [Mesorhizobium sp. INR15]|uniref:alpha/beta hydrolase n=1 Tax=Mesorhizobium sp. INR15 TaxID=2654248 RepID=UPI00189690FC|nr:alpha/beta fold hydrolase [Mesorhizobium sp. INR15]QPC95903.1 alpha/beta fold hydrolase [Mesorhizobium sp. INR15]
MTDPKLTTQSPPLSGGAAQAILPTQDWGAKQRIDVGPYTVARVEFRSGGEQIIGNLFQPAGSVTGPRVVILGPIGTVKEQAPIQYATRLARAGITTLIFDPRGTGESSGQPRRWESGVRKTEDLLAALDFLAEWPGIDPARLHILGVCQGANWAIAAALKAARLHSIALVAGHYLTPEVCRMYYGNDAAVAARVANGQAAAAAFAADGSVEYVPIVNEDANQQSPNVILNFEAARLYYHPWGGRNMFLGHRGLWENRIAAMSEAELWTTRTDIAVTKLTTPTLMVHADRAASGPKVPRDLFAAIPAVQKQLLWLGTQTQFQFYEDPITIDAATKWVSDYFLKPT